MKRLTILFSLTFLFTTCGPLVLDADKANAYQSCPDCKQYASKRGYVGYVLRDALTWPKTKENLECVRLLREYLKTGDDKTFKKLASDDDLLCFDY